MRKALNKLTGKLERLGKDARAYVAVASDKKKLEAENKRLLAALRAVSVPYDIRKTKAENERLRAVIIRAKDALVDGQSTQWVHDLLVAAILEGR